MKTIFRTAVFAALLVTASCAKDETSSEEQQSQEQEEQLESTPLEVNMVSDNVVINGGTQEDGTPPVPNGAISLNLSDAGQTAFLGEGFEVSLDSDAELVGAYIQFKAKDGTIADSYYDVDLDANKTEDSGKSSKKRNLKKNAFDLSSKIDEVELDVDFNENIEPGEFCYVLCVYDAEGNISEPEEVCLTVESWGGSSELIGLWKLTKDDYTQEGVTVSADLGEEVCSDGSELECSGQGTFQSIYCTTTDKFNIEFNEDGSYTYELFISGRDTDYNTSMESCQVVFEPSDFYYTSSGKWAYIKSENKLAMLEFEYDEDSYTGTYEIGEAYALYDETVELSESSLVLTDKYYIDYEETNLREEKYYFEKQ